MAYLMAYTKQSEPVNVNLSLHLAYSEDGVDFEALNAGQGIRFASRIDGDHTIEHPFIVKRSDQSYCLLASSSSRPGKLSLYDSEDLIIFNNERIIDLAIDNTIDCIFAQSSDGLITVSVKSEGQIHTYETADLKQFNEVESVDFEFPMLAYRQAPVDAEVSQILPIDSIVAERIKAKLLPIHNTAISSLPPSIVMKAGEAVALPDRVQASYSDGTKHDVPVTWNTEGIDLTKPSTHTVSGTIAYETFDNPFIEAKADPWIILADDGKYYFTASYPMYGAGDEDGYSRVTLRRADTIAALAEADEVAIWINNSEDGIYKNIWAPEIHQIKGHWYVFFTGSIEAGNIFGIRPQLLRCEAGLDPLKPENWKEAKRMLALPEDEVSFTQFSLDMTTFEVRGQHYVCWAEKTISDSVLYLATIDPDEPWQLTSKPMLLTQPEFAWEQIRYRVNEGAAALKHEGKVFLCFSAAGTGPEYCIGVLSADEDADLMDSSSWTKNPYPILSTSDVSGEYGPGHNSFTKDGEGRDIFVYHARSEACFNNECPWSNEDPLHDPCRHARIKPVHWTFDGTPVLKMTTDQFVEPRWRDVMIELTIL